METDQERLQSLLIERSLAIGEFTLSSGARSSYYIDARLTTMSAEGQSLIGQVGHATIREHWPEAKWVGGLTLGADPIAYAIAHRSWLNADPIGAFTVRKRPKDHGTAALIEGGLAKGDSVVVVEDTLTSGSSALQAVGAVETLGAKVLGILAIVDREAGGGDRIREAGYSLVSLFTAEELLEIAGGG